MTKPRLEGHETDATTEGYQGQKEWIARQKKTRWTSLEKDTGGRDEINRGGYQGTSSKIGKNRPKRGTRDNFLKESQI